MISNQSPAMTQRLQQAIALLTSLPASEQDRLAGILMDTINESDTEPAPSPGIPAKRILELVEKLTASIPESEWSKLPTDLSTELDHYLYGSPKRHS
ncbi:MAG: hypothetical protein AAF485_21240 [Chloroflexota bacterium]